MPRKILIIDRDESMREVLEDYFSSLGYETFSFRSIDLVHRDLSLADQEAIEFAVIEQDFCRNTLKSCVLEFRKIFGHVPLVVTTLPGLEVPESLVDPQLGLVQKPFSLYQLLDILDDMHSTPEATGTYTK